MDDKYMCVISLVLIIFLLLSYNKSIEKFDNVCNDDIAYDFEHSIHKNSTRCLSPYVTDEERSRFGCTPININTRGVEGGFYQRGYLKKVRSDGDDSNQALDELPLYERKRVIKVNNRQSYDPKYDPTAFQIQDLKNNTLYYTTNDYRYPLKIPITYKGYNCQGDIGCEELQHGDIVSIPELEASYTVVRCSDALASVTDKCKPGYEWKRYIEKKPPVYWKLEFV